MSQLLVAHSFLLFTALFTCFLRLLALSYGKPHWLHLLQWSSERLFKLDKVLALGQLLLAFCFSSFPQRPMRKMVENCTAYTCWCAALRGPLRLSSGAAGPRLRVTTNSDFIVGRPLTQSGHL